MDSFVEILTDVFTDKGGILMIADGEWQDLDVVSLKFAKSGARARATDAAASSAASSDPLPEVLEWVQFPWLLQEHWEHFQGGFSGQQPARAGQPGAAQPGEAQRPPRDTDLFDMDPDEVWHELQAQRQMWRGQQEQAVRDFKVHIRGGQWIAEHTGVAADSTRAQASSYIATRFCQLFAQHKSATFSHAMYTEHFAYKLAEVCCHRM